MHILEKVLYNPGIPVFIILERHCNIVMWYYHMPRVSQLLMKTKLVQHVNRMSERQKDMPKDRQTDRETDRRQNDFSA